MSITQAILAIFFAIAFAQYSNAQVNGQFETGLPRASKHSMRR